MLKLRKVFSILVAALFLLGLGVLLYFNQLADQMLFYKYDKAWWQTSHPASCTPYRQSYFEDLRPKASSSKPLELSCEEALKLPAQSAYAQTSDGLKIHYRIFFTQHKKAPLLLHVSGITSDWLNGARYVPAAQRMGFQLVTMEMRNHGNSDNNGLGTRYGCHESADILAVLKALHEKEPDRKIMLWGTSGATMAILNAAEDLSKDPLIQTILLENPISSLRDVAEAKKPGLPPFVYNFAMGMASLKGGVDFQACAPTAQAPKLLKKVWVTVSQKDQLTPVWMAQKIVQALPQGSLKMYPEGNHERIWNGQPEAYETDIRLQGQPLPTELIERASYIADDAPSKQEK
ncbi:hypothetical protein COW36_23800 [bacterium (Candidatus Blackallbacteria) CG17_big_fil_post_rev_8_21_14_2_50_48_46]|uniref:Serine aminopeptidase S33 domain-containing protein n=1 Tax=bacterium (Candidatus Blackallbacteria) CG17_big_fil_post_rev_8_21_14_2_50_48_46 TaxID=2014261 RepID=A0A2M7FY04_9BACT|nr:MAG: hypothetical protein COW64_18010 [bacterium (Candidatus Blackallbacteria) CG18_big_fil_WC_8_21_14_2_50_49_26]PIW14062.1 MAG: hypothetical protein COW36_23800 [bacterium (Candidatus Blackallbacteria) CG17_big_fil_post_rev_8_21_14_2_50_48_46]PIW50719.1 MAG: hypothetical protein COW20_01425 [bacterium (Candidatus Blackallbacteria) CG13_big_fil_rev_8_21_14_2_50_49_14]